MAYQLDGDFIDFCSCGEQCYCQPQGEGDGHDCQAVNAWHITRGMVGDTDVSGLTLVSLSQLHGHVMAGRSLSYYLDAKATDAQRQALEHGAGTLCSARSIAFVDRQPQQSGEVLRVQFQRTVVGRTRFRIQLLDPLRRDQRSGVAHVQPFNIATNCSTFRREYVGIIRKRDSQVVEERIRPRIVMRLLEQRPVLPLGLAEDARITHGALRHCQFQQTESVGGAA
jgi:hypothetical protein